MTHRDLTDQGNVCYCEKQVFFIALPIFQNQSKTKTIPSFLRHSLTIILDTKLSFMVGSLSWRH